MLRSLLASVAFVAVPSAANACSRIDYPIGWELNAGSVIFTGQVIDFEFYEVRRSSLEWAQRRLDEITGFPENRGCRYGVRVVEVFHGNPDRVIDVYTDLDWDTGECLWGYEVGQTAFFNADLDDEGRIYLSLFEFLCRSVYGEEDFRAEAERRRYGWLE